MRILVYDGGCPFCTEASRVIVRLGLIPDAGRRTLAELPDDLARIAESAGIENALVVLDTETLEARAGARGLLWLLRGTGLGWLAVLLGRRPFLPLLEAAYRFVAKNRYALFPPHRRPIRCACGLPVGERITSDARAGGPRSPPPAPTPRGRSGDL